MTSSLRPACSILIVGICCQNLKVKPILFRRKKTFHLIKKQRVDCPKTSEFITFRNNIYVNNVRSSLAEVSSTLNKWHQMISDIAKIIKSDSLSVPKNDHRVIKELLRPTCLQVSIYLEVVSHGARRCVSRHDLHVSGRKSTRVELLSEKAPSEIMNNEAQGTPWNTDSLFAQSVGRWPFNIKLQTRRTQKFLQ
jgi:hypothetical protein